MSDNIYNILNNFNKVAQEPQQPGIQSQPKAKTRLQENMDRVLAEKYMGFKKTAAEGRVDGVSKSVKSIYYPDKAKSPIKKSPTAYTAQGETNFKKYPDQKSRPASVNADPASRSAMGEGEIEESGLQYHTGVKKHGEKYMKMAAAAGRKGASQAEIGRLRDKHSKAYKEGVAPGQDYSITKNGVRRKATKAEYDSEMMAAQKPVSKTVDEGNDGNKAEPMKKAAKDAKSNKVQEVAPPGAKAERMVKHIKKGYAKDGKLTNTEKSKAYGATWKARNKGKVEEAVRAMFEAGFTKEQIVEGWDDMMKAVANRSNDMKTGEKRQGAKGEIEKTSSGIKHTRRYDRKTGETETGSDGQQVKRSRGRPKKSTFESATTAKKMIAEHFREFIEGSIQGGVWTSNPPKKGQPNVPVPQNPDGGSVSPAPKTVPSKPTSPMGSIEGGVWTSEPPKPGEKGVPVPVPVDEDDMEEGNEFSGALDAARDSGEETFKVNGKTYPVKEGQELLQMLRIAGIKVLEDTQIDECGMSPISGYAQDMQDSQGNMNISTNMNSDGNKSVTISADGNSALELLQMLKLAGMAGGDMPQEKPEGVMVVSTGDDEELSERMPLPKIGADGQPDPTDMQKLQQAMTSRQQQSQELTKQNALNTAKPETPNPATQSSSDTPSPGIPQKSVDVPEEQEVDEAKDERYHASTTPEEHVMSVQVQTKGGNGDVAGKEKKMTPNGYQFGDNPQAMKESMSLKLIKEYETIKVKK